jgi:hypothetical protein
MKPENDGLLSRAILEKMFTQFLSAPDKCETTSDISTQREISTDLQDLKPYPAFLPDLSSKYVLLNPNQPLSRPNCR